jgi:hypothetical protein
VIKAAADDDDVKTEITSVVYGLLVRGRNAAAAATATATVLKEMINVV